MNKVLHCTLGCALVCCWVLYASVSHAQSCGAITCDCGNLPVGGFQMACDRREKALQESCVTKVDISKAICGLQGPQATLRATVLKAPTIQSGIDVSAEKERIESVVWSLSQDAEYSQKAFDFADIPSAKRILKVARKNLKDLYSSQHSIAATIESERKRKSFWRKHGDAMNDLSKTWVSYAEKVLASADEKGGKELLVVAKLVADVTSTILAQAAEAEALAESHKSASMAWSKASSLSAATLGLFEKYSVGKSLVGKYKRLTASRLYRSGYHWVINGNIEEAIKVLEQSLAYAPYPTLLEEVSFVPEPEEASVNPVLSNQ